MINLMLSTYLVFHAAVRARPRSSWLEVRDRYGCVDTAPLPDRAASSPCGCGAACLRPRHRSTRPGPTTRHPPFPASTRLAHGVSVVAPQTHRVASSPRDGGGACPRPRRAPCLYGLMTVAQPRRCYCRCRYDLA